MQCRLQFGHLWQKLEFYYLNKIFFKYFILIYFILYLGIRRSIELLGRKEECHNYATVPVPT